MFVGVGAHTETKQQLPVFSSIHISGSFRPPLNELMEPETPLEEGPANTKAVLRLPAARISCTKQVVSTVKWRKNREVYAALSPGSSSESWESINYRDLNTSEISSF